MELINGYYITEERRHRAFAVSQARYEEASRKSQDCTSWEYWEDQYTNGPQQHALGGVHTGTSANLIFSIGDGEGRNV